MGGEFVTRAEEMAVLALEHLHTRLAEYATQRLAQAPIPGLHQHHGLRTQPRKVRRQHLGQTAATAARTVLDDHPFIAQCIAEVAHAGEEQRDADEARAQRGRIVRRLGHPYPVLRRIETVEGRGATVELIDEDEDQVAHGPLSPVTRSAYYPATPSNLQRPP